MLTPTCSECNRAIPREDINVANDVAYCRECNLTYKLSTLASGLEFDDRVNLSTPPAGAWYRQTSMEIVIGGTHRSLSTAIGPLALGLFWNGIVSVFVVLAISATLHNLHITPPHWFPAPKMNGSDMNADDFFVVFPDALHRDRLDNVWCIPFPSRWENRSAYPKQQRHCFHRHRHLRLSSAL
jgi:hypothetical protein